MSYGSAKSSGSSSESESSASYSESSAYDDSSSSSSSGGFFYDSSSESTGSSSSSSSEDSGGNPFGFLVIDLIGIRGFPDWWKLEFENVPESLDQDGGTPYYMSLMPSPGPDIVRILVRLDLAYTADIVGYGTTADFYVYANHALTGDPATYPGLRVEATYKGETLWMYHDPVPYKSAPPADHPICPITVWEDGTFALD